MSKNQTAISTSPATAPAIEARSASGASIGGTTPGSRNGKRKDVVEALSALEAASKASCGLLPPATDSDEATCIETFVRLVNEGIKAWTIAGEILVALVKMNGGKVFDKIIAQCPWMTTNLLWNFYKIGTHELWP